MGLSNLDARHQAVLSKDMVGKTVQVRGWIYRTRSSGGIVFAVLRDQSGIVQVTVKKGNLPDNDFDVGDEGRHRIVGHHRGDGLARTSGRQAGTRSGDARSRSSAAAEPFPITEYQSTELLLDLRHLWIRSREQTAVMKVKASLLKGARDWFHENDYTEVTPPIVTGVAPEDSTLLFQIKYFDRIAYLSQTAQFYLESLIYSREKVYSLTPSFRAEKSRTPRHLAEFWHLEMEAAWIDNEENMKVQEQLLTAMVHNAVKRVPGRAAAAQARPGGPARGSSLRSTAWQLLRGDGLPPEEGPGCLLGQRTSVPSRSAS